MSDHITPQQLQQHLLEATGIHGEAIQILDRDVRTMKLLVTSAAVHAAERKVRETREKLLEFEMEVAVMLLQAGAHFMAIRTPPPGHGLSAAGLKAYGEIADQLIEKECDPAAIKIALKAADLVAAARESYATLARKVAEARHAFNRRRLG